MNNRMAHTQKSHYRCRDYTQQIRTIVGKGEEREAPVNRGKRKGTEKFG